MENLWDLSHTLAKEYLQGFAKPWEALAGIKDFVQALGEGIMQNAECKMQSAKFSPPVSCADSPLVRGGLGRTPGDGCPYERDDVGIVPYELLRPGVWVHSTAKVAETAYIAPPCVIGANSEIRHCAFIRGGVLVGENCVVGNSVEIKNAILFDGVQVPHFNYVGDSILGYKAHLGAGAVTSNVRGDKGPVKIAGESTGRKKMGAFLGDFAEIGCNAVLNPGTVIGRNSQVYPTACVRGVVPESSIYKNDGSIVKKNA